MCIISKSIIDFLIIKENEMAKLIKLAKDFTYDISKNHVSAYSALTSYFIIMSVIPFALILLSLIKFTPVTEDALIKLIDNLLPGMFYPVINGIVEELYERAVAFISISVVIAVWSSAKCILAITNGFNLIFEVEETRNYFILRLRSAGYTLAFVIAIVASLILSVFGEMLEEFLMKHFAVVASVFHRILDWKLLIMMVVQIIIFSLMYKFLPNRKGKLKNQLPGAVFSSIGWNLFSYIFSVYIGYGRFSYTYGSLTTLIAAMLWLYFCIYIIFIGAQINSFFEPQIRYAAKRNMERKQSNKKKKKG